MRKNVLIISSSPRKGGNSETLAASFAKGAQDAGNHVETVWLREKQIGFCKGCLACLKAGHCVIKDDAAEIAAKMHDADVLVFATPVYYYSVSGQFKTMLDRANPLFGTDSVSYTHLKNRRCEGPQDFFSFKGLQAARRNRASAAGQSEGHRP